MSEETQDQERLRNGDLAEEGVELWVPGTRTVCDEFMHDYLVDGSSPKKRTCVHCKDSYYLVEIKNTDDAFSELYISDRFDGDGDIQIELLDATSTYMDRDQVRQLRDHLNDLLEGRIHGQRDE